jgi:cyclophilin family peptidyl-prolyl cis-trans isomerase/HEAT repeat protein
LPFAAVLVTAVAAACGSARPAPPPLPTPVAQPEPPPHPRTRALNDAEIVALGELLLFEDRRTLDLARIAELLQDTSAEVRGRAALAAGRIGDRHATPLLLAALDDSVAAVRVNAVFALGLLRDTANAVTQALAARLRNADDTLAMEAASALGKLATPAAFTELTRLLAASGRPGPAHREALLALFRFRQVGVAVNLIAPYLEHADASVRWNAAWILARSGAPNGVALLLRHVHDPDVLVRSQVLRGLRAPPADSAGERLAARAALVSALADAEASVRINALGALGTYGPTIAATMTPLMQDGDANVRMAAVLALGAAGGPDAASVLETTAANGEQHFGVRAAALGALATIDARRSAPVAAGWATSGRWLERFFAARTLGNGPWSDVRELLHSLAADGDGRVGRAAMGAVMRAADTTAEAYAFYIDGLRARDPRVRAAALAGIGRRGGPENLGVLMDAYEQALNDSVPDAALAAIDALGELRRKGTPVEAAFFSRFPVPSDAEVRQRAERRLGGAWRDAPAPAATLRGAPFYQDVVRRLVAPVLAGQPPLKLRIVTEHGEIIVEFATADAPLTVLNLIGLIERGYFDAGGDPDARRWHRVVPNFVLQDGDARGDNSGGPGYAIRDEINRLRYGRGMLGMALSGPDTGGSQFFITHSPQPHLDGGYTIFGRVVSGMDVADRVVQEDRILRMEIIRP